MAARRKNKTRTGLIVVEVIILIILTVALFAAIWVTQKLSLVNYDTKFDRSQVKTATEANREQSKKKNETTDAEVSSADDEYYEYEDDGYDPDDYYEDPSGEAVLPNSDLEGVDMIALVGLDTRPLDVDDAEYDMENSDTMIICCINHNTKTIKLVSVYRDTYLNIGKDYYGQKNYYTKANEAYNIGGPEQFLTMLNLNLDLDITEYVTVEFKALATAIEMLGGLDVDMTYQEVYHLNNYNIETAAACDMEYVKIEIPDLPSEDYYGAMTRTYHLNGSQAVSYARIRYTDGFDFRRASRQRLILALLKEKAKNADIVTINKVLNAVLPLVTTNLDSAKILSMAVPVLSYSMTTEDQSGFPFVHLEDDGTSTGLDCVLPVTLEYNVSRLHEMLFPGVEYTPSNIVKKYSKEIIKRTGYDDSFIAPASEVPDDAEIPQYENGIPTSSGEAAQTGEGEATGEDYPEDEYYYDEETGEYVHY